jgi:formamidase
MGHNRWHPAIAPAIEATPGEPIVVTAPLGTGEQIDRTSCHEDLLSLSFEDDLLAGPIYVQSAEPGDLLAIDVIEVETDDFGFTGIFPGFGFLADVFDKPYLVKWELKGGYAVSQELPGVRILGAPFPGTIGVAPDLDLMESLRDREAALSTRAGLDLSAFSPPPIPTEAEDGLSTLPPRETGGNLDIRHLGVGSRLFFHVRVPGALVSLGDIHFAQGEGEVCGSAIETGARVTLGFEVVKSPPWRPRFPAFESSRDVAKRYVATSGIPVTDSGVNELLDVTLAARRALLEMIDYLSSTYGFEQEAAYVLASVAGELRVSQIVDLPNALVSLLLPTDVFCDYRSPA